MKIHSSSRTLALFAALLFGCLSCSPPLYQPGEAAHLASTPVPPQDRPDYFRVEDDVYLFHFAEGTGKEILFLHGGPGFPPAVPHPGLSRLKGFRVVYPHERGSGRSTRPVDRFSSSNYYANLKELERRLGLSVQLADIEKMRILMKQERLIIVGHSFGGFIAALYAAEFPEHVDRLILIAPAGVLRMPPADGGLYEQVGRNLPPSAKDSFNSYLKRFFDYGHIFEKDERELSSLNEEFFPFYAQAARATGMPGVPAQIPPSTGTAGTADVFPWTGGWVMHAAFLSLGRKNNLIEMMDQVKARTLIIHGAKDLSPPESSSDYRRIKNHRMVIMQDSGHFPFTDHPDEFAAIVQQFLADQ